MVNISFKGYTLTYHILLKEIQLKQLNKKLYIFHF